jgi:hypothetical protein
MKEIDFVFVDKRTEQSPGIPLFCPLCKFCMRTYDDRTSYETKECCYKCALTFADSRLEQWKDGWRPTTEEIQEEVDKRLSIPVSVDLSMLRDS